MINKGGNGSTLAVAKSVLFLTVPPHGGWAQSLPIHLTLTFTACSAPLSPQPHITEWLSLASPLRLCTRLRQKPQLGWPGDCPHQQCLSSEGGFTPYFKSSLLWKATENIKLSVVTTDIQGQGGERGYRQREKWKNIGRGKERNDREGEMT